MITSQSGRAMQAGEARITMADVAPPVTFYKSIAAGAKNNTAKA
jgi:hypothetical protein